MIKTTSLTKSFGKNIVLENINISFEPGKVYGIVGKNGAGKTTLFNCLLRLENHSGSIESTLGTIKNITGYLPTDPYFLSHITGKEYLKLMSNARNININNFKERNIFNLPLNQYAETYSTGMKKKLALTGILIQKNDVFILDEPFNGVDIESNILINQIIKRLKELNKTIILSSHIFSTLKDNCDILYYLENNSIAEGIKKDDFHIVEERLQGKGLKLNELDF